LMQERLSGSEKASERKALRRQVQREVAEEEKERRRLEKEAEAEAKEAERAAKAEAKEAEKAAKEAAKEAEREAKEAAKESERIAKEEAKEAEKAARAEAKEAEKAAKAKAKAKEAKARAKEEAKEAERAAKEAAKEAERAAKEKRKEEKEEKVPCPECAAPILPSNLSRHLRTSCKALCAEPPCVWMPRGEALPVGYEALAAHEVEAMQEDVSAPAPAGAAAAVELEAGCKSCSRAASSTILEHVAPTDDGRRKKARMLPAAGLRPVCVMRACGGEGQRDGGGPSTLRCTECGVTWQSTWWCEYLATHASQS
jgi:uncharacterized protein YhaN